MNIATTTIVKMLESLFDGKYDACQFSVDFPEYCYDNYEKLEKEHKGLGYYLDQTVPDICDEGEPGFDPTNMINKLRIVHQEILKYNAN